MKEYTREELIDICEKAFVSEDKWKNRDSSNAQKQLGECYIFLRDGCEFEILEEDSSEDTIVLNIYTKGFCWFESFVPLKYRNREDKEKHSYFYIPTMKKLKEANGKDWY